MDQKKESTLRKLYIRRFKRISEETVEAEKKRFYLSMEKFMLEDLKEFILDRPLIKRIVSSNFKKIDRRMQKTAETIGKNDSMSNEFMQKIKSLKR